MRKLSFIVILFFFVVVAMAQENPHGDKLTIDCTVCHTTEGWKFSSATSAFNHNSTQFKLEGQHFYTNCTACHTSLVFSEAESGCISCHTDMHNNTVGPDCEQCHNSKSWIVENITEIHQLSRFPLVGAHTTASCSDCHKSASLLEFEPLGVECIDCHQQDYLATSTPNHVQSDYSTNCIECHKMDAHEWSASGINHDFFPLTKGHEIDNCATCHTNGSTEPLSPDCYSCHQSDYVSATNPSHQNSGFSTNCIECHTTEPDWKPAEFKTHDALYFPIYSGEHNGEWDNCIDCHTQPESFSAFSCIDCHEHNRSEMDSEHDDVNGYSYSSVACFACHPLGNESESFNHNATSFPLKGAHVGTNCLDCHTSGFSGTSSDCISCHQANYNQAENHASQNYPNDCLQCHSVNSWEESTFDHNATNFPLTGSHVATECAACHSQGYAGTSTSCSECHQSNYNETQNPNHLSIGISSNCEDCHTTNQGWEPALLSNHNDYYALNGAHAAISNNCYLCHAGDYNNTKNSCFGCHASEYNSTSDPAHATAQFSTDCTTCHTENVWKPSTFDHDSQYFPIYSGKHKGEWNSCSDCHNESTNYAVFSCTNCHEHSLTDMADEHSDVSGYVYNSVNCLACHPTGKD
ncbi:MAG: hypothetical protein L3J54_00950 [Draconibacterium sp.]|nr:hypothetical protein [Draconibacterium sp.]